jgi:hypothetical protein
VPLRGARIWIAGGLVAQKPSLAPAALEASRLRVIAGALNLYGRGDERIDCSLRSRVPATDAEVVLDGTARFAALDALH